MPAKLIEVFAAPGHMDTMAAIAQRFEALNFWKEPADSNATEACRIVVGPEKQQELIDELQSALTGAEPWRITIMPIEATIPELEQTEQAKRSPEQATREELYAEIERGARIDSTFLQLVILSTIVAAIGLLQDNVAVVIGGMLIAPLLGPNVAMAFGSTLGDWELISRGAVANAAGIALSIICAAGVGLLLPVGSAGAELVTQTRLGYESIILALASGAAGALSLTTRVPSTLVGVMVAVALLPPAVAFGYMLGIGELTMTAGAASLLAANIVCINLSAQLVFLSKGIKPRTWIELRAAKQSTKISLAIACGLLVALIAIVYWQRH
jgi:uncharacterized hydrophobic protein (TIGR00341 family)